MLGAGLQQDRLHRGRLSTCLARLDQLAAEIQLHATAVRLGRLTSPAHLSKAGHHSSSFRDAKESEARLQKYRGSKTDTYLLEGGGQRTGGHAGQGGRAGSERQRRRKSSVIDQLSNFLKAGLKI